MKLNTADIVIDSDPTFPIRDLQVEKTRRRSQLMESVRSVHAVMQRDRLLSEALDDALEDLAERRTPNAPHGADNRGEGNVIVVVGASGAGKSTSIRRLLSGHPLTANGKLNAPGSKAISISISSPATSSEIGRGLLSGLGYNLVRTRIDAPEAWRMVRERIRHLGILVLHLDELQHVVQTVNGAELQKVRNNLKALLVDPTHPIALIVSGTPEVIQLMQPDRQVSRRGFWIEFQSLSAAADGKMVGSFIQQLAERAELHTDPSEITRIVPRVIHAGCCQLGVIAEEIHFAIREALRADSSKLGIEHFAQAYARRTGNLSPWNPYISEHWREIDTARVLATSEEAKSSGHSKKSRKGPAK